MDVERDVGPYRLIRRLGAGGMGEVFLAHDSRLDRQVAIKHAHAERGGEEQRARFRREAFLAAKLAHPAIIPIFDIVAEEDGDWIVMEHVDGPTLRQYLETRGRPPLGIALEWAAQIARGLAAAHDKGVMHRDLKAENVMIAAGGHLKIVDFGLAKSFAADDPQLALSATGAVFGTLKSMAPEQARGFRIDHRADLFSFGVLLYELLGGGAPFAGGSPLEILTRLATEPHPSLGSRQPELPPRLVALVDRLLAKAPEARPASAGEVAEELRQLALELGVPSGEPFGAPFGEVFGEAYGAPTVAAGAGLAATLAPTAAPRAALESFVTAASPALPDFQRTAPAPAQARPALPVSRRAAVGLGVVVVAAALVAAALLGRRAFEGNGPAALAAAEPAADAESLRQAGLGKLQRWYRRDNLREAVGFFQRALLLEPGSAPLLAGLSRAYWLQSKVGGRDELPLRQARAVAEQAVQLDPLLAAAHLALGFAAVDLGDLAAAEAAFARAEMLEPGLLAAYGRGYLANARGDAAAAEAAYREALGRGESTEVENALGSLLFRQKRYPEARSAFERAIALAPDGVFGHRNLAGVLFAEGNHAAATAALQRAIEIEPNSSLYSTLGTLLFYQGLYADAKIAFEQSIDRAGQEGKAGSSASLWANLGDSYRFLPGHEEEAHLAFRRAAQLSEPEARAQPGNPDVGSRFALYLAKAGDPAAARRELAAVRALPRLEAAVLLRLILAYEALGDRAAALECVDAAFGRGLAPAEIEREPELTGLRGDPAYHRRVAALP